MKNPQELNRRDFHRLAAAAFGGVVAGAAIGCGEAKPPAKPGTTPAAGDKKPGDAAAVVVDVGDPKVHACRGLNACRSDANDCAGLALKSSVEHTCSGENTCKFLGGCGPNPGANECKGKGGCGVPMEHGDAWDRARVAFEKRMTAAGKKFGAAPAKAEGAKPAEPKPEEAKKPDEPKPEEPKPEDKKE